MTTTEQLRQVEANAKKQMEEQRGKSPETLKPTTLEKMTPSLSSMERKNRIDIEAKRRQALEIKQDAEKYEWFLDQSGIDLIHKEKDFRDLKKNIKWLEAHDKLWNVITPAADGIAIVLGDRGTGKSQAAVESIKKYCCVFKLCLYRRAREINNIMLDMQGENKREKSVAYFVKPELLVIDELQDKFDTDYAYKNLNLITDKRYANRKPTIFIANLTVKRIQEILGPVIVDRVREQGGIIIFTGQSFRSQK